MTDDFRPKVKSEEPAEESLDITPFWALALFQTVQSCEVEGSLGCRRLAKMRKVR